MVTRDELQQEAEARIQQFETKIAALKEQAAGLTDEVRDQKQEQLQLLEQKQAQAKQQLQHLKAQGHDAWDDVTDNLNAAVHELQETFDQVASNFTPATW